MIKEKWNFVNVMVLVAFCCLLLSSCASLIGASAYQNAYAKEKAKSLSGSLNGMTTNPNLK